MRHLNLKKKSFLLLLFSFLKMHLFYAQGPDLLIQQYHKNSIDLEYFQKWNFDFSISINRFNSSNRNTNGLISLGFGSTIYYRLKKSFGISSGIEVLNYSYNYLDSDPNLIDKLKYLNFPLSLKVFPSKKLIIEFGVFYNKILNAKKREKSSKEWIEYEKGIFLNSLGFLSSIKFNFWKKFKLGINYRFQKNSKNVFKKEPNNFRGISIEINHPIIIIKK